MPEAYFPPEHKPVIAQADRRKEFRELLFRRNWANHELFMCSIASLPDPVVCEAVKAKLAERAAILERIAQLQSEDSSLRDIYPVPKGLCVEMIMEYRRLRRKEVMMNVEQG